MLCYTVLLLQTLGLGFGLALRQIDSPSWHWPWY